MTRVVIGGTARWPWSYYDVTHVRIVHSDLYNNGYTTLSDDAEGDRHPGLGDRGRLRRLVRARRAACCAATCAPVLYVESDDWPSMPMTLLHRLVEVGGLRVVSGPVVIGGYRVWTLFSGAPCPPRASPSGETPRVRTPSLRWARGTDGAGAVGRRTSSLVTAR